MEKVSQERIERFWKWCGASLEHEWDNEVHGYEITDPICQRCGMSSWPPVSKDSKCLLPIDLNNLFKWAVPKVQGLGYNLHIHVDAKRGRTKTVIANAFTSYQANDKDSTTALFLAIEKLVEEGNRTHSGTSTLTRMISLWWLRQKRRLYGNYRWEK